MADIISRVSPHEKIEIKRLDITIYELTPTMSKEQAETMQKATQQDTTLQLLMQQMIKGWPIEGCRKLPDGPKPYWQFREHLAIEHSCITWKGRYFMPIALRPHCLKVLHNGHPGVTKMTLRAQSSMFWPGINKQITEYIHSCDPCQTISNLQQKEPAIPMEVPCGH